MPVTTGRQRRPGTVEDLSAWVKVRVNVLRIVSVSRGEGLTPCFVPSLCRERSSLAITGEGLAMAGVGYDLASLSVPKFGTTTTNPKKLKRKAEKRARAEECERREGRLKVTDAAGVSDSSCTHE